MSHLSASNLSQLHDVAFEIREVFGARGHLVDGALALDPAFRDSTSTRSDLTRSLVKNAVRGAASRMGIEHNSVSGGALELRFDAGAVIQSLRVKRAKRQANGELLIVTNNASSWGTINEELLIPEEPWVFAFIASEQGIDEILVSRVEDVTSGTPGRLVLGPEIPLEHNGGPSPHGFRGDNSSALPGFSEEDTEFRIFGNGEW